MKHLLGAGLLGVLCLLLPGSVVRAQDKVLYRDRVNKKDVEASGTVVNETAARISLKGATGGGNKEIPALDVLDVAYEVPGAVRLDYGRARIEEKKLESAAKEEERKKALADLIKGYQDLVPKLAGDRSKFAQRQCQFKAAQLRARLADEDPSQLPGAIDALLAFKKDHPDSWQITACTRLLGRLLTDKGDIDAAQKVYQDLAATPGLARESKQECDLLISQALIAGKKYAEAQQRLVQLQRAVAPDDPTATRVQLYLAECIAGAGDLTRAVPQIEGIIAKTPDPDLKAAAYNALGDSYRMNGRAKDALWAYLWVDVLYHQDRQEHIRAMIQLAKLFDELGDGARAKQYRDKLGRGESR